MDPVFMELLPQSDDDKFLSFPYEERWSNLKRVIVHLYTRKRASDGRTATLDQVVEFMRTYYSFHAAYVTLHTSQSIHLPLLRPVEVPPVFQLTAFDGSHTEYRRRFKDWGVTKRMTTKAKDATTSALVKRKQPGASVSDVVTQHDGKNTPFEYKKLKRYLISRKACLDIAPGLLSSWNLPYAALISSFPQDPEARSPFGPIGPTPDTLQIQSPGPLTPGRAASGPSPRMQLIYEKHKEHCTSLFLQGRLEQLLVSLPREDRSFVLAKNWSQEIPYPNSTQTVGLTSQTRNANSPWTPSAFLNLSSGPSSPEVSNTTSITCPPTQLCKWSIHISFESYYGAVDRVEATALEDSQPPADHDARSFVDSLHQSMVSNDFTTTTKADLPLAQDMITRSLEEDPAALQLDAWKLAIMAGNTELLSQLSEDNGKIPEGIEAIYPFHLAAAFLNGGNQCCRVLTELQELLPSAFTFYHNIDDHGHTILDALVVDVLRSHTNIQPSDAVPADVIEAWSGSCRVGWDCLTDVLAVAMSHQEQGRSGRSQRSSSPQGDEWPSTPASSFSESSNPDSCSWSFRDTYHNDWINLPCNGPRIGLLWASIQTELLTYRRVRDGDSWISKSFSMEAIKRWLDKDDTELSMPLVQNQMFKRHTSCGWFNIAEDFLCPIAEEVCTEHFMNMDIFSRTSYIETPNLLRSFEDVYQIEDKEV
ncbi:hypothetical protein FPRO05_10555 [Fusarium proliferatum]|uniref:Clr5 domain-containing protein n=1 Tax=Gibberella intermedia TaxID=948311 RepID=A0A365NBS5_GIBIN|nr:hypothetical protein FPRO05_10555 [Fusarium proliferatum]